LLGWDLPNNAWQLRRDASPLRAQAPRCRAPDGFFERLTGVGTGICGNWEDDDAEPSSPLSCASTTAAFSDDAIELLEGDANSNAEFVEVMEVMEVAPSEAIDQEDTRAWCADSCTSPRVGARGLVHQHNQSAADVAKLGLSLLPEAAAHSGRGAQCVVDQENGEKRIDAMPSDAAKTRLFIPTSEIKTSVAKKKMQTQQTATVRAGQVAQKRAPKRKLATMTLSDEEMIASLADCVSGPTTPAASGGGGLSAMADFGLVAALQGTLESSQTDMIGSEGMSDEELTAALAGCAGEASEVTSNDSIKEKHALPCPDMEHWNHSSSSYDEGAHDDGVLEMALFDSSE